MPASKSSSATIAETIAKLAQPPKTGTLHPIAARFVYSLRLIAVHERAKRDPVPELTMRLGSVEVAAKSLALAQEVRSIWPEDIHLGRFCCEFLSHDEATLAAVISSAFRRNHAGFDGAIDGFIRPDRRHRLWEGVLALIDAELRAA